MVFCKSLTARIAIQKVRKSANGADPTNKTMVNIGFVSKTRSRANPPNNARNTISSVRQPTCPPNRTGTLTGKVGTFLGSGVIPLEFMAGEFYHSPIQIVNLLEHGESCSCRPGKPGVEECTNQDDPKGQDAHCQREGTRDRQGRIFNLLG